MWRRTASFLGSFYGNADEGAIGAEELVDLF
jgi:hypothetical protein